MKIRLWKTKEGKIKTFTDLRNEIETKIEPELPISDDEIMQMIRERVIAGELSVVNDKLLDWCNAYAKYQDASRYLSQYELEESICCIYHVIESKDECCGIKESIEEGCKEGKELLEKLNMLIKK